MTSQSGAQQDSKPISASAAKLRLLQSLRCTTLLEQAARRKGAQRVAGVDEAGRGCLFGPVVAGACILNPKDRIRGLRDSKLLPAERREIGMVFQSYAIWPHMTVHEVPKDRTAAGVVPIEGTNPAARADALERVPAFFASAMPSRAR